MAESFEKLEKGERSVESVEQQTAVGERVGRAIEVAKSQKELSAAQSYESIARGLTRWAGERATDIGEIAGNAAERLGQSELGDTELGKKVLGGLEKVRTLAEKGAEFLEREEVEAFVVLAALAFLLLTRPEQAAELLGKNPELLTKSLQSLGVLG
jgi:hypothetical protein